jgi:hypothetical protein
MNRKLKTVIAAASLGGTLALGVAIGQASADQPMMHAALNDLRQARAHLVQGSPDKGGHRGKAIRLVNQAIDEVQEGIRWDRRH